METAIVRGDGRGEYNMEVKNDEETIHLGWYEVLK